MGRRGAAALVLAVAVGCGSGGGAPTTDANGQPCASAMSQRAFAEVAAFEDAPGDGVYESEPDGGRISLCLGDPQGLCWGLHDDINAWRDARVNYAASTGATCASQPVVDAYLAAFCRLEADTRVSRPGSVPVFHFPAVPDHPCSGDAGVPAD